MTWDAARIGAAVVQRCAAAEVGWVQRRIPVRTRVHAAQDGAYMEF